MKNLILLRGPSGSGKSTIANHLLVSDFSDLEVSWHEADHFFGRGDDYKFDASKLSEAHSTCQSDVRKCMEHGYDRIIVSNTSMARWEMNPYLQLAREHAYNVVVLRTPGPWDAEILQARNVHGVPLKTLTKQIAKYQPHEDEQEWTNMAIFE
jgi:predicted kinase